jgi:hypothetical protein
MADIVSCTINPKLACVAGALLCHPAAHTGQDVMLSKCQVRDELTTCSAQLQLPGKLLVQGCEMELKCCFPRTLVRAIVTANLREVRAENRTVCCRAEPPKMKSLEH